MDDQLALLRLIAARLGSEGIPYMLTGSVAMSIYSEPRMTRDIDLIVECAGTDAEVWMRLFAADCYISEEAVRDALDHGGMFNIIHLDSVAKADFIVRGTEEYRRVEFGRRVRKKLGDIEIHVVAPEDLILSKLLWWMDGGSALQRADLELLLKSPLPLDLDYLGHWAGRLGVADRLKELQG